MSLTEDASPSVVVRLAKDESASVSGMVQDARGNAIADALVSVIGRPASATTADNGSFVLEINASTGEMVQVHAEKSDFNAVTQSHMAGPDPAVLVLMNE